ncbi:MAG TPA: hypothetical protein VFZ78_08285 [Flavisolibacter sp.]
MKKLMTTLLILVSLASFAQNNKWFVSVSSNRNFGGPAASIKKQMNRQGFNHTSLATFFGITISEDHPVINKSPNLMLHAGKRIDARKSVYIAAGIADISEVSGYKIEGNPSGFWLLDGTYGNNPSVKTKLYQLSVGYLFSEKRRAKWGVAPSLFVMDYTLTNYDESDRHTAFTAGITGTARIPLGRERRLVGVDLITALNLVPPVKMKSGKADSRYFSPGSVNMIFGSLGLALSFRR